MKEFTLIFRTVEILTSWMNWIGGIAAQNKLVDRGHRLGVANSKTVKPGNVVVDGPYTEIKEFINGYLIVKAADVNEAVTLTKGCPIFFSGGSIEVRPIVASEDNS
jgi:hypothetical protein